MNTNHPAFSYHQGAARGATPVGQIVVLYDTILRDFARALAALQAGDIESRVQELNHALLVIAHLQNVLDHERGEEAAKQLAQFYNVTRGMIVQANIQASPETLEQLVCLYRDLRQAWQQIDQQSPGSHGNEAPRAPRTMPIEMRDAGPVSDDAEAPPLRWSA